MQLPQIKAGMVHKLQGAGSCMLWTLNVLFFFFLNAFWLILNVPRSRTVTQREEIGIKVNLFQLLGNPHPFSRAIMEGSTGIQSIWPQWRPTPPRAGAVGSSLQITTIKNGESFFSSPLTALSQRPHPLTMVRFVLCFSPSLPLPAVAQGDAVPQGPLKLWAPQPLNKSLGGRMLFQNELHEEITLKRPNIN